METREKIDNVLREIDMAVKCIWKISINVFDEINPVILEVNDLIADFLNRADLRNIVATYEEEDVFS